VECASAPYRGKRRHLFYVPPDGQSRQSYSLDRLNPNRRGPNSRGVPQGNADDTSAPEDCPPPKVTNFTVDGGLPAKFLEQSTCFFFLAGHRPWLATWIDRAKTRLSPDNSRVSLLGSVTSELP
jgi:hypothetical protein